MQFASALASVTISFVVGSLIQDRYDLSDGRYVLSLDGDRERKGSGWRLAMSVESM